MCVIDWSEAPTGCIGALVTKESNVHHPKVTFALSIEKTGCMLRGIACEGYNLSAAADCWEWVPRPGYTAWNRKSLPTIGTMVRVIDNGTLRYGVNEQGPVIAHVEDCAVVRMSYGLGCFEASVLAPVLTAEQIAKQEREAAILQMIEDAGRPVTAKTKDQASALFDAGWRKVEQPK